MSYMCSGDGECSESTRNESPSAQRRLRKVPPPRAEGTVVFSTGDNHNPSDSFSRMYPYPSWFRNSFIPSLSGRPVGTIEVTGILRTPLGGVTKSGAIVLAINTSTYKVETAPTARLRRAFRSYASMKSSSSRIYTGALNTMRAPAPFFAISIAACTVSCCLFVYIHSGSRVQLLITEDPGGTTPPLSRVIDPTRPPSAYQPRRLWKAKALTGSP